MKFQLPSVRRRPPTRVHAHLLPVTRFATAAPLCLPLLLSARLAVGCESERERERVYLVALSCCIIHQLREQLCARKRVGGGGGGLLWHKQRVECKELTAPRT